MGIDSYYSQCKKFYYFWTSPVVQCSTIHPAMQGTWVQPLVWEDTTCHGATKPVRRNY